MDASAAWLFFISLLVLTVTPGVGAVVVINATMRYGWKAAVATIIGIVSADYIFVLAAFFGMHLLLSSFAFLLHILQWVGVGYIALLGVRLLIKKHDQPIESPKTHKRTDGSYIGQYLLGLLVTLGNPKAIIYYSSIMPTLVGTAALSIAQLLLVMLLVALVVVGVMIPYAYLAHTTHKVGISATKTRAIRIIAGCALILTSGLLGAHIVFA